MKRYPFKFLDAYTPEDTDIFFGREEEVNALYEMVFQTDILLVYGASGTGKTSLIQCGLASRFQSHDWLALNIRRGNDLNAAFEKAVADAGGNQASEDLDWLADDLEETTTTTVTAQSLSPLAQAFKAIYLNYFRPIYLIFDQFEELYILGEKAEQEQFIQTVADILTFEQPIKLIFSIREEYLGHLYDFEKAVPQLLRKKLRVEPMNLDKVRQVIDGATHHKNTNIHLQAGEETAIAEQIFEKIKGTEKTLTIQLPYLQVFLDKFYLTITQDEHRQADATFTSEAIQKIGDIGDVLRDFLEEQVTIISKRLISAYPDATTDTIWKILSPFATLEGTKEPISRQTLLERLPNLNAHLVNAALQAFVGCPIVRYLEKEQLYEVAHDSLAKCIADKRGDEEIALLEIRRLIKSQMALKADARAFFTEKQLNFIEPYLEKLAFSSDESTLIEQSYQAVQVQKNKQRRRSLFTILGIGVLVVIIIFTYFLLKQQQVTQSALDEVKKEKAANDRLKFEELERRAIIILDVGGCPIEILKEMSTIAENYQDNILNTKLNTLYIKNPSCQ